VSKKKQHRTSADPDPLAQMFSGLWAALAAGDVLQAEIETARCVSVFHQLGIDQDKSDSIFIGMAKQGGKPEDAALLRLVMLLGSPTVKSQARTALGELTGKGVYPASWVTEAGKAEPVRASRVYDVFGDWEDITVTFRYADGEHTLVARVDLANLPQVRQLALVDELPAPADDPHDAREEISLPEARLHLESALLAAELDGFLAPETAALLPVAKARLRRLPADDVKPGREYGREDRAALVREFLASPHATEAVAADEDSTRFWAEILTAWSSRIPWHPPLQLGPRTVRYVLNEHAPSTYPVTPRQLEQLAPAATAWARWSAAQRGLDEEHMASLLPDALTAFPILYDDDYAVEHRAYLADVVTSDVDVVTLVNAWATRTIAIPPSEDREEEDTGLEALDATSRDDRATYLAADFASCRPPSGMSRDEFIAVVCQVAEELWDTELSETRKHALALVAEHDRGRHDIMHALVAHTLSRRS
jgi:hypothetical protein